MKIEVAESMFLSWLRHVKECQLVQTNWKPSPEWERKNHAIMDQLLKKSSEAFPLYNIYKENAGVDQLLKQAEIDVLGVAFDEDKGKIYAIDVAFHEAGLNYGSREETISRVIKKCLRAAMCISSYFSHSDAEIIFSSPKINPAIASDIFALIGVMNQILMDFNLSYKIRIIANDDLNKHILSPLISVLGTVADTSELFLRSIQLYELTSRSTPPALRGPGIAVPRPDLFQEMKIGVIARTVLRNILESGIVSRDEIEKMQDRDYSKRTFHIQFPVLRKVGGLDSQRPAKYYSAPVRCFDDLYFICSEWYETSANNDRPYLVKWIEHYSSKEAQ